MMEYLCILGAAVAAWLFGALWYTVLGKQYQTALGLNPDDCKDKKMPLTPLLVCFVAELVMALALCYVLARMSVVGWSWGAMAGAIIAIGVVVPTVVVNNIFPGRKPALSLIDGAHWIGVIVIESTILGFCA